MIVSVYGLNVAAERATVDFATATILMAFYIFQNCELFLPPSSGYELSRDRAITLSFSILRTCHAVFVARIHSLMT